MFSRKIKSFKISNERIDQTDFTQENEETRLSEKLIYAINKMFTK